MHGCMAAWLHGCMPAWMHGCMDAGISLEPCILSYSPMLIRACCAARSFRHFRPRVEGRVLLGPVKRKALGAVDQVPFAHVGVSKLL